MDLIGTTFAGYQVHRLIMRTALVSLYHAIWAGGPNHRGSLARPVSLWVSDPLDRRSTAVAGEFARRAELSAAIEHPALTAVLDVGSAGGRVFYVTPPTDARTLDEYISRDGPLSQGDAITLLSGVADGLDVAHAAGLVHGAISPATIWVERTSGSPPRAMLTGFGLDALLRIQASGDQRDLLLDDVLYIAPEQLRGDDGVGGRADQYAIACALHHCVTGRPPFVRDRTSALFGAHMLARPTPPLSGGTAFDDAVMGGMAKDPDERFASCVSLLETAAQRRIARPSRDQAAHERPAPLHQPAASDDRVQSDEDRALEDVLRDAVSRGAGADAETANAGPARGESAGAVAAGTEAADARSAGGHDHDAAIPLDIRAVPDRLQRRTRRQRTRRHVMRLAAGLVALVVVAGGAVLAWGALNRETPNEPQAERRAVSTTTAAQSETAAAVVAWQREIGDEAVLHLGVEGLNAVAATGNDLTVVNPLTGSRRWRKVADVGVLNDLVTIGDVLVYRTDVLSGISLPYGIQLWESKDVAVAPGGLTAGAAEIYTMAPGRILSEVASVDPATGEERWHFHGRDLNVDSGAALAAGGDMIVVLQRRALFGLDPQREPLVTTNDDGSRHTEITEERWRENVDSPWTETLVTTETEAVFALQDGNVCSHSLEDGTKQWCVQITRVRDGAPALAVHDETVIVVAGDRMIALDLASGRERWGVETSDPLLPLLAVDGNMVTVADTEGTVQTFTASAGARQWDAGGLGDITALTAADGGVIVGTKDGVLARVEPRSSIAES